MNQESKGDSTREHPPQYRATGKRGQKLSRAKAKVKSTDPEVRQRGWEERDRMEKKARKNPNWENKPRADSESANESLEALRELIAEVITEELSKKTKATLRKKAEKRGLTPSSVEAEYKKGLAAWGTSGSRPGMSQHQWAMARVNSANPSKSWAVVKKSKRKKSKKK